MGLREQGLYFRHLGLEDGDVHCFEAEAESPGHLGIMDWTSQHGVWGLGNGIGSQIPVMKINLLSGIINIVISCPLPVFELHVLRAPVSSIRVNHVPGGPNGSQGRVVECEIERRGREGGDASLYLE